MTNYALLPRNMSAANENKNPWTIKWCHFLFLKRWNIHVHEQFITIPKCRSVCVLFQKNYYTVFDVLLDNHVIKLPCNFF